MSRRTSASTVQSSVPTQVCTVQSPETCPQHTVLSTPNLQIHPSTVAKVGKKPCWVYSTQFDGCWLCSYSPRLTYLVCLYVFDSPVDGRVELPVKGVQVNGIKKVGHISDGFFIKSVSTLATTSNLLTGGGESKLELRWDCTRQIPYHDVGRLTVSQMAAGGGGKRWYFVAVY